MSQIELSIQKGIRQAEDKLVQWIEEALEQAKYGVKEELKDSQFRNLVRVADTTISPRVIKNFLLYQVGRESGKWGSGNSSLAARIIQDIDGNLKEEANRIAEAAQCSDPNEIHVELIRRYLGYGARYLTYLNYEKNNSRKDKKKAS